MHIFKYLFTLALLAAIGLFYINWSQRDTHDTSTGISGPVTEHPKDAPNRPNAERLSTSASSSVKTNTQLSEEATWLQEMLLQVSAYIEAGETDNAMELLEGVLKRDPNSIPGRMLLCEVLLDKAKYPDALAVAESLIKTDSDMASAYYLSAFARSGMEEYIEAVADMSAYIQLTDPSDDQAHAMLLRQQWLEILEQ